MTRRALLALLAAAAMLRPALAVARPLGGGFVLRDGWILRESDL